MGGWKLPPWSQPITLPPYSTTTGNCLLQSLVVSAATDRLCDWIWLHLRSAADRDRSRLVLVAVLAADT